MTDFAVERLLDELAPAVPEETDAWADVLARAEALAPPSGPRLRRRRRQRRAPRRGVLVVALALVAIVIVVAAAYALSRTVVDFGSAPKAPERVVVDFSRMDLGAPPGMASNVLPHETRRITSVAIDGEQHVLWVAPTAKGGFCELWSDLMGGCRAVREGGLDVSVESTRNGTAAAVLTGSFFDRGGERLEVSFADGTSDEIPLVWVTAPIDAGFYAYRVPDANRVRERRPVSVTLFDSSGTVLRRESVVDVAAESPPAPPTAETMKRRPLFDWHIHRGRRLALWATPGPGDRRCMVASLSAGLVEGCTTAAGPSTPLGELSTDGGTTVTLCCRVGRDVARVEAVFQDGDRVELTPKSGYLLWPIPRRHDVAGHRLDALVAYDAAGRLLARHRISTGAYLYACTNPNPPKDAACG